LYKSDANRLDRPGKIHGSLAPLSMETDEEKGEEFQIQRPFSAM